LHTWFYNTITLWGTISKNFTHEDAIKTLVYCIIILFDFFQKIVLFLNLSLCADLYLSFKTPFYPNGRRLTKYFIFTVAVVFITIPATRGAVLESPTGLFKNFFEPLIINTEQDPNIVGSALLRKIAAKDYMNPTYEYDAVKFTNLFYLQSINCLIILCFMLSAAASTGYSMNVISQGVRSIDS